jgi:hypothetical protein
VPPLLVSQLKQGFCEYQIVKESFFALAQLAREALREGRYPSQG